MVFGLVEIPMTKQMKKVKKAVFPVGGLGTRFLPATKAMPKEMLPIVDKPLIQYAVEEAAAAGIEEFIFVTGRNKTAIEDHFDQSYELESTLKGKAKTKELFDLRSIVFKPGAVTYTRQQQPLGLGHAVWCARHLIQDEPFAVLLADDFIYSTKPCLQQMVEAYEKTGSNILAIMTVPDDQVSRYGIVAPKSDADSNQQLFEIAKVVEKPILEKAPSNHAVVGRYILHSDIFDILDAQKAGVGGEIQLTDAFEPLMKSHPFHGFRYEGERLDCGSKAGYIKANLRVAVDREEMSDDIIAYLKDILPNHNIKVSQA